MENRKIQIRKYYAVEISLASPLSISSGQDDMTDMDVLVNGAGEVFVPGTSLAGAMRNYLEQEKNKKGMMGYSNGEDGQMSSVFISDLYFDGKPVVSVRDGVQLYDEEKDWKKVEGSDRKQVEESDWNQVINKFDMQIVETGARGILYLNYLVREGENQENFERQIANVFCAIQDNTIRIGAHKNRGFGRLKINKIYEKEFRKDEKNDINIKEWCEFKRNFKEIGQYPEGISFDDWKKDKTAPDGRYVKITVPLKLTGGISIRKYSATPKEADYEQITCNGDPVIPGSSWNGAIRADVRDILSSLGLESTQIAEKIKTWFGYVGTEKESQGKGEDSENDWAKEEVSKEKTAEQSRVVIAESVIENSTRLPMTRNQINRFDASTIDGALYSEVAYFGGTTELEIMVKKDRDSETDHSWHALLAILTMVIQDIQEGYVPVGGQTAIGRGIFEANGEIAYSEDVSRKEGMSELYSLL